MPERQTLLIVCEGTRTEPNYFRGFRLTSASIEAVGFGMNTVSLVNRCIAEVEKQRSKRNVFDQVWCVFDRDSFPAADFNQAIVLAQANNIQVAWSNEAFELWYVLHFQLLEAACTRKQYIEQLNQALGAKYQKNDVGILASYGHCRLLRCNMPSSLKKCGLRVGRQRCSAHAPQ